MTCPDGGTSSTSNFQLPTPNDQLPTTTKAQSPALYCSVIGNSAFALS